MGGSAKENAGDLLDVHGRHAGAGGVWPFSGFFSKDGILAAAARARILLCSSSAWWSPLLTTFYMFRLVFVVFLGARQIGRGRHMRTNRPAS